MISAVRTQRNMLFHVIVAVVVLVASLLLDVSRLELAVLVLTILLVFVTELFNTAMEFVVDLATREYHPLAKPAKTTSAGPSWSPASGPCSSAILYWRTTWGRSPWRP